MALRAISKANNGIKEGFSRILLRPLSTISSRNVVEMAAKDGELRVFVVSGEVSGDAIASRLMGSLKNITPLPIRFAGVGGQQWDQRGFFKDFIETPFNNFKQKCSGNGCQRWRVESVHGVGEVFGDTIATRLMGSLKKIYPLPIRFAGVGGSLMSKEGLQSLFPIEDIAVMGIWELLPHLNKIRVKLKVATEAAYSFRPHAVVTVDSKGFSFRLLKQLRAKYDKHISDSPVHIHYVSPSFWAWKGGEERLKGLTGFVDHVLCILPFEEEVCRSNGLAATFVGHPILEDALDLNPGKGTTPNEWKVQGNGESFRRKHGLTPGDTVLTLLPGSRLQEVSRMLPIFSDTLRLLKHSFPDLTTIIPVAPNHQVDKYIHREIQKWPVSTVLISGESPFLKYDAFSASRAALSTSGTAALELQLARLPCVIAYRAHILTEWYIRYKAKIPYISLPNILLDSPVIPEVLFQACTPKNLATSLMKVIDNEDVRKDQIVAAEKVLGLLFPERNFRNQELISGLPYYTPSVTAASTILYSVRRHD